MRFTLAALLLFTTPDDAEVARALRNLAQLHSMASVLEVRRLAKMERPVDLPPDPWGTPYKLEGTRIVSAGSDRKFEAGPLKNEQFAGTEGDTVFDNGAMFRSNRNWLYPLAKQGDAAKALDELRAAELQAMMMRNEEMQHLMLARLTIAAMQLPDTKKDAWGRDLRFQGPRRISAGSDGVFDPDSWRRAPNLDLREDIIVDNKSPTRFVDEPGYLKKHRPAGVAIPQPPDPGLEGTRVEGDVKAPVVTSRVEPEYDAAYRGARIGGRVILVAHFRKDGAIEDPRVLVSAAPELDMAAVQAVRQWKFRPATRNGEPLDVIFHVTIDFKPR